VYATAATGTWLAELFDCAPSSVTIRLSDSQSDFDIRLQLGEPENPASPAYQIDVEEILIVTHRESPLQNMTVDEVRALFEGQGAPSAQVWAYSSGEDIQITFEQAVMAGRSVTSSARLAVSPQQMSDVLNADANAVGILPRHWKMGASRSIYTIPNVPVLAITETEPDETLKSLIACLQK
jgi:TorA maturation chaperone TorD